MTDPAPRLNLGSGTHYAEGWVNVDLYEPPVGSKFPDVFASIYDLPFEDDYFAAAYLGHLIEHLVWNDIPDGFAELRRVLKPGATVMVVGPCLYRAIATQQPRFIIEAIVADPRNPPTGHGHAWTPTEELTRLALERGGLVDVTTLGIVGVAPPQWPNPSTAPWQTAAMGRVP